MNGYRRHRLVRQDGTAVHLALYEQEPAGASSSPAVVFQHGLCADASQPAAVFPGDAVASGASGGVARHVVLECRGHGSSDAGPLEALSIATFTDDLAAAIESLAIAPCIVGGISMGAAIALRLACTRPELVSGLVLARPAWVCQAGPENMRPNLEIGGLLARDYHAGEKELFLTSPLGRRLAADAPDNLASLSTFFGRQPRDVTAALLQNIAADGPGVEPADLARLTIPTLVIGNADDMIHPLSHATALADAIPNAAFLEIPAKARDRALHTAALGDALRHFIQDNR